MIAGWPSWVIGMGGQEKRPRRASGKRKRKESSDLAFEVEDNPFEVHFVEDLLAFSSAEKECAAAQVVDLAVDAFGMIINSGQEAV